MPVYDEKFVSPFAVRFSQDRIRPTFQDKYPVQASLDEIGLIETPSDSRYDVILDAPFPLIEVIRWKPKLRNEDGSALEDANGGCVYGESCWFTLDNRRLYCLQCAAMRCWPRRAAARVRVLCTPAARSSILKFQTTTEGRTVLVSRRHDPSLGTWDWVEATRSKGGDPMHVIATLSAIKSDCETSNLDGLSDAPAAGPVRRGVIEQQQSEQNGTTGSSPCPSQVSVSRLFELAACHNAEPGRSSADPFSNAFNSTDWAGILTAAADAGESVPQAKLGSLLRKACAGPPGLDNAGWVAADDATWADDDWHEAPAWDNNTTTWDEASWNTKEDSSALKGKGSGAAWKGSRADWKGKGSTSWQEDAAWEDDAEWKQTTSWEDSGWAASDEASQTIRSIAGMWTGAKGESYTVEEHNWLVLRNDSRGCRRYTLNWDAQKKVLRWGDQFYLSKVDDRAGRITWTHNQNAHRTWIWKRSH